MIEINLPDKTFIKINIIMYIHWELKMGDMGQFLPCLPTFLPFLVLLHVHSPSFWSKSDGELNKSVFFTDKLFLPEGDVIGVEVDGVLDGEGAGLFNTSLYVRSNVSSVLCPELMPATFPPRAAR